MEHFKLGTDRISRLLQHAHPGSEADQLKACPPAILRSTSPLCNSTNNFASEYCLTFWGHFTNCSCRFLIVLQDGSPEISQGPVGEASVCRLPGRRVDDDRFVVDGGQEFCQEYPAWLTASVRVLMSARVAADAERTPRSAIQHELDVLRIVHQAEHADRPGGVMSRYFSISAGATERQPCRQLPGKILRLEYLFSPSISR